MKNFWWLVATISMMGCGTEGFELAVTVPEPGCTPEAATYQLRVRYEEATCVWGPCQQSGASIAECLTGIETPVVDDGKPVVFTVGIFDDARQLVACARADVDEGVEPGDAINLAFSCNLSGCPTTLRDSQFDCN